MSDKNSKKIQNFSITKFVTLNVAKDWINGIKDILGLEQKSYSDLVNDKCKEIFKEIEKDGKIVWFRQTIDRTFKNTIQITIYGQLEGD